jgi:hypothetical protein
LKRFKPNLTENETMPLAEQLPNLAQLQGYRKTGRFDPNLKPKKIDVMKSRIVGLKIGGELVGFGKLEIPTPAEIERLKQPLSKCADLSTAELNEVFDDSPILPPQWSERVQTIGLFEEVSKSASIQENSEPIPEPLEGIFPTWLRSN